MDFMGENAATVQLTPGASSNESAGSCDASSVLPALWKLRQGDCKFKARLGCMVSSWLGSRREYKFQNAYITEHDKSVSTLYTPLQVQL